MDWKEGGALAEEGSQVQQQPHSAEDGEKVKRPASRIRG